MSRIDPLNYGEDVSITRRNGAWLIRWSSDPTGDDHWDAFGSLATAKRFVRKQFGVVRWIETGPDRYYGVVLASKNEADL